MTGPDKRAFPLRAVALAACGVAVLALVFVAPKGSPDAPAPKSTETPAPAVTPPAVAPAAPNIVDADATQREAAPVARKPTNVPIAQPTDPAATIFGHVKDAISKKPLP